MIIKRVSIDLAKNSFSICASMRMIKSYSNKRLNAKIYWRFVRIWPADRDNQIPGFLAEFGVLVQKGVNTLKRDWTKLRSEKGTDLIYYTFP